MGNYRGDKSCVFFVYGKPNSDQAKHCYLYNNVCTDTRGTDTNKYTAYRMCKAPHPTVSAAWRTKKPNPKPNPEPITSKIAQKDAEVPAKEDDVTPKEEVEKDEKDEDTKVPAKEDDETPKEEVEKDEKEAETEVPAKEDDDTPKEEVEKDEKDADTEVPASFSSFSTSSFG